MYALVFVIGVSVGVLLGMVLASMLSMSNDPTPNRDGGAGAGDFGDDEPGAEAALSHPCARADGGMCAETNRAARIASLYPQRRPKVRR